VLSRRLGAMASRQKNGTLEIEVHLTTGSIER
jgi:hypothetical protein